MLPHSLNYRCISKNRGAYSESYEIQQSRVGAHKQACRRNLLVKISSYGRYGFPVKSIVYDINEIEFRYLLKVVIKVVASYLIYSNFDIYIVFYISYCL